MVDPCSVSDTWGWEALCRQHRGDLTKAVGDADGYNVSKTNGLRVPLG